MEVEVSASGAVWPSSGAVVELSVGIELSEGGALKNELVAVWVGESTPFPITLFRVAPSLAASSSPLVVVGRCRQNGSVYRMVYRGRSASSCCSAELGQPR